MIIGAGHPGTTATSGTRKGKAGLRQGKEWVREGKGDESSP